MWNYMRKLFGKKEQESRILVHVTPGTKIKDSFVEIGTGIDNTIYAPPKTHNDLRALIVDFTNKNKKMPTKLFGTYEQMYDVSYFNNYVPTMGGAIRTPINEITLELDADAVDWYLA